MRYTVEREEADYVVVGSGAGGATVAKTLSDAGMEVVILEEGPHFPPEARTTSVAKTMHSAMRDGGLSVMMGRPIIPYLQGRCVGGTTVVNGAIVWRLPEDVHAQWLDADPGLERTMGYERLASSFDAIEADLGIRPVQPGVEGRANTLIREGCERLGWQGRKIERNERGCRGSGRCLQGCPHSAKQSMEESYIPMALANGARLHAQARAEALRFEGNRAVAVVARVESEDEDRDGADRYLLAHARHGVVLAAGAVQTPNLLRRNGIGGRRVGDGLMCHPGTSLAGRFPEPVDPWTGATQGFEVTELRSQGVKLESFLFPPEFGSMRLPGVGPTLVERMAELDRCATLGAAIKAEGVGRVRPQGRTSARVSYSLTERDVTLAHRGLWAIAQVMRAAGAQAVLPGVHGWPQELDAKTAPEWILENRPRATDLKLAATHLLGGCNIGSDPSRSIVSPSLAVHGVKGLYIADASVFPANIGVNPQHTIMAIAMNGAKLWLEDNA